MDNRTAYPLAGSANPASAGILALDPSALEKKTRVGLYIGVV
jgi:hypothetical protein